VVPRVNKPFLRVAALIGQSRVTWWIEVCPVEQLHYVRSWVVYSATSWRRRWNRVAAECWCRWLSAWRWRCSLGRGGSRRRTHVLIASLRRRWSSLVTLNGRDLASGGRQLVHPSVRPSVRLSVVLRICKSVGRSHRQAARYMWPWDIAECAVEAEHAGDYSCLIFCGPQIGQLNGPVPRPVDGFPRIQYHRLFCETGRGDERRNKIVYVNCVVSRMRMHAEWFIMRWQK
jgi:hypothetical protein